MYHLDPTTGCWVWDRCLTRGYGMVRVWEILFRAHKLMYQLYRGPIPKGMVCRHLCDNPRCVNPYHLQLGSQRDNIQDMVSKGRNKRIISEQEKIDISKSDKTRKSLAIQYKVSERCITRIKHDSRKKDQDHG